MTTVSEKIKAIRSEMQISQKQLSRMLYVSRGYVANLELGKSTPSAKVLKRINKLYKAIPQVQVLTPKPVEVKTTWIDKLLSFLFGWRS